MQFAAGNLAKAKTPLLVADKSMKGDEEINKALYSIYMLGDKNKPLARERARTLYALKPVDKDYAYNLARLESELKSPAEAVKILEKPALKDGLDAEMSFLLLDGYFKTGQRDRAAALAPTLIRKFPEESKRSLPLAILFYENKNRTKAKEILESYVRNNQSEEAHYYLGKIFFEEKNWNGAIDNLARADESRPDALGMLGQSYIQNQRARTRPSRPTRPITRRPRTPRCWSSCTTCTRRPPTPRAPRPSWRGSSPPSRATWTTGWSWRSCTAGAGTSRRPKAQYEMILKKNPDPSGVEHEPGHDPGRAQELRSRHQDAGNRPGQVPGQRRRLAFPGRRLPRREAGGLRPGGLQEVLQAEPEERPRGRVQDAARQGAGQRGRAAGAPTRT